MNQEQIELRFAALEAKVDQVESRVRSNSTELGANSRATLTFLGMLLVMVLIGSRFSAATGYTYQLEVEKLTELLTVPAIAALLAAVVPGLRK